MIRNIKAYRRKLRRQREALEEEIFVAKLVIIVFESTLNLLNELDSERRDR